MNLTQEQILQAGFELSAAPSGEWRSHDEQHPVPAYFDFDWLSARHPDLYHAFALSSVGLMAELDQLLDLTGLAAADVGAGTGRSTLALARKARHVTAVEPYAGAAKFGAQQVHAAGLKNAEYLRGDCSHLPLANSSLDAVVSAWAVLDTGEAFRVLKPGGWLVMMGAAPGALCGELTATLADLYPELISMVAPAEWYQAGYPASQETIETSTWNNIPVLSQYIRHDFTCLADYGSPQEAAAINGRLYGPRAKRYFLDRQQSTFAWRLRIEIGRIKK